MRPVDAARPTMLALLGLCSLLGACRIEVQAVDRGSSVHPAYRDFVPGRINPDAPPETAQFGRLVGIWRATQTSRNADGTWSDQETEADWIWYYILDGHAIQDDWISPPLDHDTVTTPRFRGTNIRIYRSDAGRWEMAWIDQNSRAVATFTAVEQNGDIQMRGTDARGRLARNTFSNVSDSAFDWTKEWTFDEGATWVPVSRIHATRIR